MKKLFSHQFFYLLGFIIIGILLGSAQYLQIYKGVNPCPLCILQRITFGLLGILFIFGIIFSDRRLGQIFIGSLTFITSVLGSVLAGRQVWLQYLPADAGANCEVSLQYMLKALPFEQVMQKILVGGSGCSQVGWRLFNLSLAQWSFVFFIFFLFFSIWQLRKK